MSGLIRIRTGAQLGAEGAAQTVGNIDRDEQQRQLFDEKMNEIRRKRASDEGYAKGLAAVFNNEGPDPLPTNEQVLADAGDGEGQHYLVRMGGLTHAYQQRLQQNRQQKLNEYSQLLEQVTDPVDATRLAKFAADELEAEERIQAQGYAVTRAQRALDRGLLNPRQDDGERDQFDIEQEQAVREEIRGMIEQVKAGEIEPAELDRFVSERKHNALLERREKRARSAVIERDSPVLMQEPKTAEEAAYQYELAGLIERLESDYNYTLKDYYRDRTDLKTQGSRQRRSQQTLSARDWMSLQKQLEESDFDFDANTEEGQRQLFAAGQNLLAMMNAGQGAGMNPANSLAARAAGVDTAPPKPKPAPGDVPTISATDKQLRGIRDVLASGITRGTPEFTAAMEKLGLPEVFQLDADSLHRYKIYKQGGPQVNREDQGEGVTDLRKSTMGERGDSGPHPFTRRQGQVGRM